jgi:hypothetical protein
MKKNCWEVKKCGREPGGAGVKELGVCPAAAEKKLDGINRGKNGGRSCWAVGGTMCFGAVQGSFAKKIGGCMHCDFLEQVKQEEGADWVCTKDILNKLK